LRMVPSGVSMSAVRLSGHPPGRAAAQRAARLSRRSGESAYTGHPGQR
jgi:hypothetical protein